MYCKNCGIEIDVGTKFCPNCGVNQEHTNEVTDTEYKIAEDFNQYTQPIEDGNDNYTDVVSAMVGKNSKYFIESFDRIKEGKSGKFNVAAFFLTGVYALYRKMYNYFYLSFIPLVISIISAFVLIFSIMTLQFGGIATYIGLNVVSFIAMIVISITMGVKFNKSYYEKITKDINNKSITSYSIENDQNVKEFVQKNYGTSIKNVCIYMAIIIAIMTVIYTQVYKYEEDEYDSAYEIVEEVEDEESENESTSNAIKTTSHKKDVKSDSTKDAPVEKEENDTPSKSNRLVGKYSPKDTKIIKENSSLLSHREDFLFIGDGFTDNELFDGYLYDYMICHTDNGDTYLRLIFKIEPYQNMCMLDVNSHFELIALDGDTGDYIDSIDAECLYGAIYDFTGVLMNQSYTVDPLTSMGAYNEYGESFVAYDYNITNYPKDAYFSPVLIDEEIDSIVATFTCFYIMNY